MHGQQVHPPHSRRSVSRVLVLYVLQKLGVSPFRPSKHTGRRNPTTDNLRACQAHGVDEILRTDVVQNETRGHTVKSQLKDTPEHSLHEMKLMTAVPNPTGKLNHGARETSRNVSRLPGHVLCAVSGYREQLHTSL